FFFSIRSFFQPKSKDKDIQKKTTDETVKNPLKVQNGVQEVDSPIKKVAKRSRQILESDEEDEASVVKEQVISKGQGDKEAPSKTEKVKGSDVSHLFIFIYCSVMFLQKLIEENTDEPMEEGAKEERVEKAVTEKRPDEEMENKRKEEEGEKAKEEELVDKKGSDEKEKKAEGAEKKNEAKGKTDDEKGPAAAKKEEVEKDTREGEESPKSQTAKKQKDKEPTKKAPISSFFVDYTLNSCLKHVFFLSESTSGQTDYDPSRSGYHPVDHACWKQGQKYVKPYYTSIPLSFPRLRNIETLSNLFRSVLLLSPDDLLCCVYLCLNQLGPAYLGMELGVGETVLMKAVAQATGRQLDKIKAEAQEKGDLGLVAESSRSNQRMMFQPASLTAGGVFRKLKEIASMSGNSAMNKKIDIIKGLFVACRFSEARYIVRSLAGKLRIGLAEQSILSALSQAVCLTPPGQGFPPAVIDAGKGMSAESRRAWIEEKSLILKQTYCEMPNYDVLIPVLLKEGIDQLPNHCKLTPGVPLRPMLAHPTKGVGEVMKKFDEAAFTCEYKYDGERAQIHILESGEVRIFSRNQEDNTSKYPDIISRIPKVKKDSVVSCVLDSEAVAWDREKKQIQPFQVLTTRKRKDVDASEIKVQVCVYAFDLLYLNGESLVRQPLCRRRALLKESFSEVEGEFLFARSIDSDNTDTIAEFLEQSVRDSCEGLMVKTLEKDATYEIAKRSHNWLKLKKDYLEGVGDTVDLCVIGAYLGKGKRTGTYGGFLLACYDDENEEFQSVCKIGTGFKDEDLEQHYKFLKVPFSVQLTEDKCSHIQYIRSILYPDSVYYCPQVDPEKGISLRFPRFLRIRDDKKPEDATTGAQIADLYKRQQQIQNQGDKADPEDYY
uniref:DNA ligase n=1 Tax=Anabas testudineus TaxID=64144 RepID=A0A7N6BKH9_ANATE